MRAVTFDFWETLVHTDPAALRDARVNAWVDVLACCGHPVEPPVLGAVLDRVAERFDNAWTANLQYGMTEAVSEATELLGLDADLRPALTSAWLGASRRATVEPAAGIHTVLDSLVARGVALAVVCDVGLTPAEVLLDYLERLDLLRYFSHFTWSEQVGVFKPSLRMFDHALEALGVTDPATAMHVGDRRRTDVAGARARGMVSIRYRGFVDDLTDLDEADVVVSSHTELLPMALGSPVR